MSEKADYLAWLHRHALDDGIFAEAYDALGAQARSVLKLCMARLYAFWGERPLERKTDIVHAQGFAATCLTRPAPYALVFCQASYAHPSCLLAACLPAILAGVPLIVPCLIGNMPKAVSQKTKEGALPGAAALLTALELAGLEQAVHADEADALEAVALFRANLGAGRMILLGDEGFGEAFALAAHRLGLPLFCGLGPPLCSLEGKIVVGGGTTAGFSGGKEENGSFAVEGTENAEAEPLLHLDEAHAGLWVWPGLGPDWFRSSSLSFCKADSP